jgi:cytochrome c oxidase subunit IV
MANHSTHSASGPAAHTHTHEGAAHSHSHGHHGGHDVAKEVRKYMLVFGALLVGTLITVWASFIDFGGAARNIAVALIIATVKAALVGAFFMHLIDERKMVYGVLGATIFFFIGLMYLTLWSTAPESFIHFKH